MTTLDHLFVLVRGAAPGEPARAVADEIAGAFERAGFRRAASRRHAGQGTENRRFVVGDFMFELLFLVSAEEAEAPRTAPLALGARFGGADASPFGFASRPAGAASRAAPWPHVTYRPAYLPPGPAVDVAVGVPPSEPLWFHLAFLDPDGAAHRAADAPRHPNGAARLDAVTLATPVPLGERSRRIAAGLGVALADGAPAHRVTLRFDGGRRGERLVPDARLPLAIER